MAAPATSPTTWPWPADVVALATQENVLPFLEPLREMTHQLIPTGHWRGAHVEHDPELADLRWIIFDVQVPGLTVPEAVEVEKRWIRELLRICPPQVALHFLLGLDVVSA